MKNERRRNERLPWVRFESKVHVRRSLIKKEWISVVPFDYSRYGMGVQTDEAYEIGDSMTLSLELIKDETQVSIAEIKGIVRYKEKHHSRFNYGVEFTFSSRTQKMKFDDDLIKIERFLINFEAAKASLDDKNALNGV